MKHFIKKIANYLGYDIIPIMRGTNISCSYSHLLKLGFNPHTVIDVGVEKGSPELYDAFPNSYFLLIEPLKEFELKMKSILTEVRGTYLVAAAGAQSKQVTFNVHKNHLAGSSLYKETMGPEEDGYEITVPMIRIDDIIKEREIIGPYLLKVDVQGAELDVLEGFQEGLRETEVVVLEVSMFQFLKGAPQFHEVIFFMKNHGFVAYDIILLSNRPLDDALGQIDVVFVKENGQFRQDHSWAAGLNEY